MHLAHHEAFQRFLYEFSVTRDYFECHELLEDLWKKLAPRNKNHELVGFILLSTGMYHWRRNNFKGAHKSFRKANLLLSQLPIEDCHFVTSFDYNHLVHSVDQAANQSAQLIPYSPMYFIVTDPYLSQQMESFPLPVEPITEEILHKHLLRDRTEVITNRLEAMKKNSQQD